MGPRDVKGSLRRKEFATLSAIVILAAFLRLYGLGEIPPGMNWDEASEGVEAARLLSGRSFPAFFHCNYGVEPLFIYLSAASFLAFGTGPWAMRLVAALVGIATVPLIYATARELFRREGQAPHKGLLAALVLALMYWHLYFSRLGIEIILMPTVVTSMILFLWRGLRTGKWRDFLLAGIFLGLGPYTYPSGRLFLAIILPFLIYLRVVRRDLIRGREWGLGVGLVVALLILVPLGYHFWRNPFYLAQRSSQVFVFSPIRREVISGSPLLVNTGRVLGMFGIRGDMDIHNNLPGRPALDPFLFSFFLVGLGVGLRRWRRPPYALLYLWLGAMILPSLLTEWAPHFRRASGAIPPIAIFASLGLVEAWAGAQRLLKTQHSIPRRTGLLGLSLLVMGGVSFSALSTYQAYFRLWATRPYLAHVFNLVLVDIARVVNVLPSEERVYLTPIERTHPTLRFFLKDETRVKSFEGRHCLLLPPDTNRAANYVIIPPWDHSSFPRLKHLYPQGTVTLETTHHLADQELYAVFFRVPEGAVPQLQPQERTNLELAGKARLLGYELDKSTFRPGDTIHLTLYWRAEGRMNERYTVFVHLLGPDGEIQSQWDREPCNLSYPTVDWGTGEILIDSYHIPIGQSAPPDEYRLAVGMYSLKTMERLSMYQAGKRLPLDRFLTKPVIIY